MPILTSVNGPGEGSLPAGAVWGGPVFPRCRALGDAEGGGF
jgi:hypothetical protein